MSTAHFRKLGRRAAQLGLTAGLALGSTALATSAAQADPIPVPWNANYHNFGSSSSSYGFIYTNPYPRPVGGVPDPRRGGGPYVITANTCKKGVAPGHSCLVKVGYTPDGQPAADSLQMNFKTLSGQPVAVPPVQLFGGGAPYVYTRHLNGAFIFPTAAAPHRQAAGQGTRSLIPFSELTLRYLANPIGPVDIGPTDLPQWLTVVGNTCTTPIEGPSGCTVTLEATQNTGALRAANFQMSFENAQTGASVPVQDVTLIQAAG